MPTRSGLDYPARFGGQPDHRCGDQESDADDRHHLIGRQHDALAGNQIVDRLIDRIGSHARLIKQGTYALVAIRKADQFCVVMRDLVIPHRCDERGGECAGQCFAGSSSGRRPNPSPDRPRWLAPDQWVGIKKKGKAKPHDNERNRDIPETHIGRCDRAPEGDPTPIQMTPAKTSLRGSCLLAA